MSYSVTLQVPYPPATWKGQETRFIMNETEEGTDIQACYIDNGVEKVSFTSYHLTTLPVLNMLPPPRH
jgi:hypothetical protein